MTGNGDNPELLEELRWRRNGELAARQAGHLATWQARALGATPTEIKRRVRVDGWARPHRSVLRMPGVPPTPEGPIWAAILAVADQGVAARQKGPVKSTLQLTQAMADIVALTGFSAAVVLGFDRHKPQRVELVVPWQVTSTRNDIRVVRSRRGIGGFWVWHEGLPLATAPRLVWDAGHLSRGRPGGVRRVADLAVFLDRTRRFPVPQLLGLVTEPTAYGLPRRPPPVLVATANELRPGFSHSGTEAKARLIAESVAAELGVRLEPAPYGVTNADGVMVGEADIACVDLRFDAEIDGPHHDYPSQKAVDQTRDRRMHDADWIVCRYSYELIDNDPEAFRRLLRRDLLRAIRAREAAAA